MKRTIENSNAIVVTKTNAISVVREIGKDLMANPHSYIFIIGAGASTSAGVPTSTDLEKVLISGPYGTDIEIKLKERRKNLEEVALEELLSIYADISAGENPVGDFLRGQLGRFSKDTFPPLSYEILAHLMNHGLIKQVISMNFDELLEIALDEEVGETNYEKVRSKSQFMKLLDDEKLSLSNMEKIPSIMERKLLLKPHGTVSYSMTLIAEYDRITILEEEKARILEKILSGKTVILVGYSFRDPDFQRFIWQLAPTSIRKLYFVDKNEHLLDSNKMASNLFSKYSSKLTGCLICLDSDTFFIKLTEGINATEEGKFLPGITRHQIRNLIFNKFKFAPTLQNKLLVELIIFALKVKGKFKTKALLSCERIRHYTRDLIAEAKAGEKFSSPYSALMKLKEEEILSIISGEEKEGKVYDIGDETCYLLSSSVEDSKQSEKTIVKEVVNNIAKKLPILIVKSNETIQKSFGNELKTLLRNLVEEFDYDLTTGIHPFEFSFKFPKRKENSIEHRKTSVALEILNDIRKNEDCYIIAETGEWLVKVKDKKLQNILKRGNIYILLTSYTKDPSNSLHRARAQRVYKQLVQKWGPGKVRFLDFDLNKHHGTFSARRCIYFYKDGKPPTLQPFELSDKNDTERLMWLCKYLLKKSSLPNE